MRLLSCTAACLLVSCATPSPDSRPGDLRIDGSSAASFDRSFAELLRRIPAEARRELALSLFGVLLDKRCLSSTAILELTFLAVSADRPADLHTCRSYLNGMTYKDIIDAAKEKESDAKAKSA